MVELWQLYDEDGNPIAGQGGTKDEIYAGALHGAAHVWIWRLHGEEIEVLLQKRTADKRTWPNYYDISAAGHIDLGEEPITTAVRETKEEIGLDIDAGDVVFVAKRRDHLLAPGGAIENEWRWVYALRLQQETEFTLEKREVESLEWKNLKTVQTDVQGPGHDYVPQGHEYFKEVFDFIEKLASSQ